MRKCSRSISVNCIKCSRDIRPNITGTFAELYGLGSAISTGALSGAFAKGSITTWLNSGLENNNKAIDFMANLSDSTFGASETIQPQSGYSLIIIKE